MSFPTLGRQFSSKYDPGIVRELGWDGVAVMCFQNMGADETVSSAVDLALKFIPKHPHWRFTLCEFDGLGHKEKEALLGDGNAEPFVPFISVRHGLKKRYVLEGTFQELSDGLDNFLVQAHAGKLVSRYKSEPRLAKAFDEGVALLTGHTFDEQVKNPKLDYFVCFTHTRCNHCTEFAPVWKKLASEVRAKGWRDRGVVIARMDMEKNECEEDVQEYPKLVLYPAVKTEHKMKKKRLFKPDRVQSLVDLPVSRLLDFLSGNAVNLEGVEEQSLEAEVARSKTKQRRKARKEL